MRFIYIYIYIFGEYNKKNVYTVGRVYLGRTNLIYVQDHPRLIIRALLYILSTILMENIYIYIKLNDIS